MLVPALAALLLVAAPPPAAPPSKLAQAIDRAALATRHPENLRREDGKVLLYGQRTNGADTRGGKRTPGADVIFYVPGPAGGVLRLASGVAALLHPADAHLTGVAAGPPGLVRKTVVKIPVRE